MEDPQLSRKPPQRQTAELVFQACLGISPVRPCKGEQSTVRPDQSNVPGLPGNKSGPALQPPTGLLNQAQDNDGEDEDEGGFFRQRRGMMMQGGYGHHGFFQGRRVMH